MMDFADFDRRPAIVAIADVPDDKLWSRYSRTIDNLQAAISRLPHVLIYDNSDLNVPYRLVAALDHGRLSHLQEPIPEWLRPAIRLGQSPDQ